MYLLCSFRISRRRRLPSWVALFRLAQALTNRVPYLTMQDTKPIMEKRSRQLAEKGGNCNTFCAIAFALMSDTVHADTAWTSGLEKGACNAPCCITVGVLWRSGLITKKVDLASLRRSLVSTSVVELAAGSNLLEDSSRRLQTAQETLFSCFLLN